MPGSLRRRRENNIKIKIKITVFWDTAPSSP
jgi:hypothetical protein